MKQSNWKTIAALVLFASTSAASMVQAQAPDLVLSNGKIVTVDDRFTIAEAVALRGERIVGVGTNQEIAQLAGPNTRTIDLGGRTVIPGLIDNHAHIMEEGPIWQLELRLDGVELRTEALEMIRQQAIDLGPGD